MTLLLMLFFFAPDLGPAKAEPDLDKRSEVALTNADLEIDAARHAYTSGDVTAERAALEEIRDSVNLSYESLRQTKKSARKNKYYKRAELKVKAILRRLTSLRDELDVDERPKVELVMTFVQQVDDQLLSDIMSKRN